MTTEEYIYSYKFPFIFKIRKVYAELRNNFTNNRQICSHLEKERLNTKILQ